MLSIEMEKMSDDFTKHHIIGLPFNTAIHHFTAKDKGSPHDHPFGFTSFILLGGYVERVYKVETDGSWTSELFYREPGTAHSVESTHIHEIVELPRGECYTLVISKEKVREWRFWKFDENGSESRVWHEGDFTYGR